MTHRALAEQQKLIPRPLVGLEGVAQEVGCCDVRHLMCSACVQRDDVVQRGRFMVGHSGIPLGGLAAYVAPVSVTLKYPPRYYLLAVGAYLKRPSACVSGPAPVPRLLLRALV